ncbi:MAG: response regulator transcription factor [Bacteroides sp.]|nr:response regulator transcription factor [Barnesiella sp.]MBD5254126.1 response regulator transcription factor [Barnesiella sp.]MBD5343970.1 response regulator transcription factor [Bacteroides sp.]MBD5369291.1 response regulator transcription factor [Bacteroides sp.]MDE5828520.1 LytTR family DNA-binding domain-containing protein [Duncaniella sp.]
MESNIKCVAIDDEPLALNIIETFCRRLGGIDLVTFSNPLEGLEYIKTERPHLVFLDIEMEPNDGLYIAARLPQETCFIFTTAYLHYALDGYDLDAVDYLHKPFAFSRFQAAFNKALRRIGRQQLKAVGQNITVKQDYNNISIPVDDILYIEAMEGYSKIFRLSGGCVVTRMLLKKLSALLPPEDFVRIHRSFIVSKSKIKTYNRQEIVLVTDATIPIGRQYAADIMNLLGS